MGAGDFVETQWFTEWFGEWFTEWFGFTEWSGDSVVWRLSGLLLTLEAWNLDTSLGGVRRPDNLCYGPQVIPYLWIKDLA